MKWYDYEEIVVETAMKILNGECDQTTAINNAMRQHNQIGHRKTFKQQVKMCVKKRGNWTLTVNGDRK